MRNCVVVLVGFLIVVSGISCTQKQGVDEMLENSVIEKILQRKDMTYIMDVLIQSDQSMIVLGMTESSFLPAHSGRPEVETPQDRVYGFLCSMSADMQIQWLHYLSPELPGRGLSLTQDHEFNIYVVHTQKLQSQEEDDSFGLFVSKYAYNDTFLQSNQISNYAVQRCESFVFDPTMERLYGIFSPENFHTIGSFAAVESISENPSTESENYFLVCLSYDGDIVWCQEIVSSVAYPTRMNIQCSFDRLRVYVVIQEEDPIEAHQATLGIIDSSIQSPKGDVLCFSSGGEAIWTALTKPSFGDYVHSITEDANGTLYCLHTKKKMVETESHIPLYITTIDKKGQMKETYLTQPVLLSSVSYYPAMHLVYNSTTDCISIIREPSLSPLSPSIPQTLFVGEFSKDFQSFVWLQEYFVTKPAVKTSIELLTFDRVKIDSSGILLIAGRIVFEMTEANLRDESATPKELKIFPAMFENMPESRYLTWDKNSSFLLRVSKSGEPFDFTFFGGSG
jgi:hypothetical protein